MFTYLHSKNLAGPSQFQIVKASVTKTSSLTAGTADRRLCHMSEKIEERMNGSASLLQQRLLEVAALFDVSGSAHIENSCAGLAGRGATQWVRARMTRHLVRCTGYAICHTPCDMHAHYDCADCARPPDRPTARRAQCQPCELRVINYNPQPAHDLLDFLLVFTAIYVSYLQFT